MLEIIKTYVAGLAFMLSVFGFGIIIFNNEKKKFTVRRLIMLLLSGATTPLIFTYFEGTYKTVLLCITFVLIFRYAFNLNYDKAIFSSLVYSIIAIIPDLLTTAIFIYIFDVGKEYYYSNLACGIVCNFSVSILMIGLIYILRKPLRKLVNYNISTSKKIILIAFLILISIAIFFYNLMKTFEFNNNILGYLVVIISLIIILFSLFKQKLENEVVLKKYDELLDVMQNYENDIEEQRTIIHETKNELMTIKCKIKDKEKPETIMKYIDSILGDKVSSSMTKYSKFKYLPSNGLKGFFYYKFIEAERKGIKISANISKQIEASYLKDLDTKDFKALVRIIGIYLDNAIEASLKSENKKVGIEIYLNSGIVKIIISNTYENNIDLNKVGKEKYSTKGKNRGHGLLLVNKILYENNMFEAKNKITDTLYVQELLVHNYPKQ